MVLINLGENNSKIKLCFVASSGGHLQEILCLKALMNESSSFLITEEDSILDESIKIKTFFVSQINRKERNFFIHFFQLFLRIYKIMRKEKPDYIISTGALIAVPACIIGKIFGKKVIFIESFARITHPSLSGHIVYKFADVFIVQWESLLKFYPKAIYSGGLF